MLLSENMYCVAFTFKITEKKEQNSTSKFSLRLYIPLWKLFGWFRRQQHWVTGDWQLQHDNRPTHVSCLCRNFLAKYQITQVNQSTYSPYLALCHIWLFPKLKSPLKGKRELCEVSRWILGRGLIPHCPMCNVSCILHPL